jgi:glutamate synthase (NADPH/NADH) small chain
MLTNPVEILGDEKGWVRGMRCIRIELGKPDDSGRRQPVEVMGSEFEMECDIVIMALGSSPNPLIASTTKNLSTDKKYRVTATDEGQTNLNGVFAGGDVVTGSATVILAMGAGKKAAKAIDEYLKNRLSA